ncbi:OsmC family protein [Amorphus orientalis]|uniref:Osmotically inducible protein OsmC n=1 Tax=Amorphus orientalis TaxID=649198 RepID=A0AAE3VRA7_9HYPH|nr:OsmC family protein [Amorphus orientalis]MDQ0317304.1 osmotically inducible protein OsmC [Amorphus orientalis]
MTIKRSGSAVWAGGLKDGKGAVSTESGALSDKSYGFATRFENEAGTNPEELLGASHAGCFTMALSLVLGDAGLTADSLHTTAEVSLDKSEDGFEITAVHLTLEGRVPGTDEAKFRELAEKAKANCPLSKVLKAKITLEASLVG